MEQITILGPLSNSSTTNHYKESQLKHSLQGIKQTLGAANLLDIINGSHATSTKALIKLATLMRLKPNDIVFDIGVGVPTLAFFFSLLTKTSTIGIDTSKTNTTIAVN